MSDLRLDGIDVLASRVTLPRTGAWIADLEVDTTRALTGTLVLTTPDGAWRGSVVSGGVDGGRWKGRIRGGAGGIMAPLDPMPYRGATLRIVVEDAVRQALEELDPTTDALGVEVGLWLQRANETLDRVLADVARAASPEHVWRVTMAGRVWVGVDTWSEVPLGVDAALVDRLEPREGRVRLRGETWGLRPGQTLAIDVEGTTRRFRVGALEHALDANRHTCTVWWVDDAERADPGARIARGVKRFVDQVTRRHDLAALFPAIVRASDGATVDVDFEPGPLPLPPSAAGIPYRTPHGIAIRPSIGSRVWVGFEACDPSRPYAVGLEGAADEVRFRGGGARVAREGDSVRVTIPPGSFLVSANAGVPNPGPVTVNGTITAGADGVFA